ncbi:TonB-dependent outer membrane protein, SusC/RagA [Gemmatirosa kalamazoonensis]|uniref:TonB-dependent outer membrane protein, SusC/RagA n=1 Tax=Gemmatirosa kalamazoonensis TaxID=861299 RepID=W0RG30_9BACT|nr:SusC/RagA family TonB-linked outer membrane protein [Gemmatirosa kalamazoonensis]AHG89280.1 TonB-dependent outer membrane protein, SusC/RagA [Gemmatirosa kalamazoonensis]
MRFLRTHSTFWLAGVLVALGSAGRAAAQAPATINGRVTSDAGVPLPGANVIITELNISVGTNAQGGFTIQIPGARVNGQTVQLRVRSVGFQPTSRPVVVRSGTQTMNFELKTDVLRLSEVVVTGVAEGTERAKVPFSVGRVTAADLPVPALDPMKALAGKVAGLRVANTGSGRPGTEPEIQLRGPTSINATGRSNGPLIIVDGAIMNVGSLSELGGLDIESVEVVKGAAGASLYGTRAANGVITITTKRGSSAGQGIRFGVRSEYGFSDLNSISYGMPLNHQLQLDETGTRFCVAGSQNVAPCSRTVDWMKEIMRINNVNADTTRTPVSLQWNALTVGGGELTNVFQSQIWPGRYFNPLAQALQRNPITLNQVDATGTLGAVRFYVSGSYQDEKGAIRGLDGAQQRRARVNVDYDIRPDLNVSVSTLYDNGATDNRNGGADGGSIFGQILRGIAIGTDMQARDTLGRLLVRSGGANLRSPTGNGGATVLYDTENRISDQTSDRYLGSITSRYTPAEWVTVEGTYAYDSRSRVQRAYRIKGYRTTSISAANNAGNLSFDNRYDRSMNGSLTATLRKQLRSDLFGKLTFRGLFDDYLLRTNGLSAEQFVVSGIYRADNATANKDINSSREQVKNVGWVTGASLDFKDRYTVDGYFRYDGSSLFGSGNRWAPYGRISGVWQFSKEPFWHIGLIDDARVRASYGTAGTPPRFSAQYETYNIAATGPSLGQAGNSKLRPEVTAETEVGLDFTLLHKVGLELTHARGTTKNQILPVNAPAALGFATQWQNAGTLQNITWELVANLPVIQKKEFNWSMRGSWDRTRTYITELFVPDFVMDAGTSQGTASLFHVTANRAKSNGFPQNRLGNIWGRKFYRTCGDLPQSVQGQCGDGKPFQRNDQGYIVWVGQGNTWRDGITKNLWSTYLPKDQSPWNWPLYFGHPIVDRPLKGEPNEGVGINQVIGNALPDFRLQFSNTVQWKRLTLYGLVDGTFGHDVNNQGEAWGLLDLSSSEFDQANKTVETAKPVGYSWRAGYTDGAGTGGFYDQLGPNNYNVEDASFAKLREVSLTYHLGKVRGVGDWTFGVIGRNLLTLTGYSGLDPEVGATSANNGGSGTNGSGSGLINQVDAFNFPTLRSFTFTVSTRF